MEHKILSVAEVAATLRIGSSNAKALVARGDISSFTVGRRRLITREALDLFVAKRIKDSQAA